MYKVPKFRLFSNKKLYLIFTQNVAFVLGCYLNLFKNKSRFADFLH